jgi:hypothetical protein
MAVAKAGVSAIPCVGKCIAASQDDKNILDCVLCSLGAGGTAFVEIGGCFTRHDC